ncbi:hypothetical protein OR16_04742 [Cupriavidus basilensis OR16]|uniref:DNA-binding protein H-NS-like C-terminal domain-containing protein n=1 Tax=Cupriavidus basilensis OR16 TaxID=1127483 RepID=H1S040_9BURK|nr:H-NS family nucleoid-associated regulatory protein [Cupriavidus basilensis]EHP44256.1 hypothetical protein OR16_04742 [Cupriavidus basilensis OR16]
MSLESERAAAIVWIRVQMARHGLTLADLQAAGCFAVVVPPPAPAPAPTRTYRDAEGRKWDGQGEMPAWLQWAVNAGQSAEHFRVG